MRFLLTFPMDSPSYHPELATGHAVVAVARAAEAAGLDGMGFTDHPAPTQRWLSAGGHDAFDPFVAMGFAAAQTTTLKLIPHVVVLPYRNPFLVAKAGATLDVLSAGRFVLAVGTGYLRGEFGALGATFDGRGALVDEALEVITSIWTEDNYSHSGQHFSAEGITAHPRPLTTPHPPIWVGGNSVAARRRVVQRATGWCPFPAPTGLAKTTRTASLDTVAQLAGGIDDLRRRLGEAGRDPAEVDIVFANQWGGAPGTPDFNAEAYLDGLEGLAKLGVTWVHLGVPADSLARAVETIEQFGEAVVAPFSR